MRTIKTKKKFGQHFLTNENVASKIVNEITSKENILEIGPGDGILTKYLLDKKLKNLLHLIVNGHCNHQKLYSPYLIEF